MVVVPDIHGAYPELTELLKASGVVNESLQWIAGETHLVSLGDLLDRGAESRKVMELLMRLQAEALNQGGRVHVVAGNHEIMNLVGDLRYVAAAEFAAFADIESADQRQDAYQDFLGQRSEAIALGFLGGGPGAAERDPKTIALNYAEHIGGADGLTYTAWKHLNETLGEKYAQRFVSAQKLASDFRSRRVASEIAAFARAGEMSRNIAERAFSNEVITPGKTTLAEVAWWMREQQFANNLGTSFGMPSVYITGPWCPPSISRHRVRESTGRPVRSSSMPRPERGIPTVYLDGPA